MAGRLLTREWARINRTCFDNLLPACPIHVGPSIYTKERIYGEYYPNGYGLGLILICPEVADTEERMLNTLAHEMIHQWQDVAGLRLDHRGLFTAYAQHITTLTGLVP